MLDSSGRCSKYGIFHDSPVIAEGTTLKWQEPVINKLNFVFVTDLVSVLYRQRCRYCQLHLGLVSNNMQLVNSDIMNNSLSSCMNTGDI
jgi:hypothetical protein